MFLDSCVFLWVDHPYLVAVRVMLAPQVPQAVALLVTSPTAQEAVPLQKTVLQP